MADCPMCAEALPQDADLAQCPHCGHALRPKAGMSTWLILLIVVGGLCVVSVPVIAVIAAIAIPNLIEARKHGNEAVAVGALKTITTAQTLYREGDKDDDKVFDYGSLRELSDVMLVDGILGTGTKQGYFFQCQPSTTTSEFLWMATADPAMPMTTGNRWFAVNQAGIVYYSDLAPIDLDTTTCELPPPGRPDVRPVGR